MTARTNYQYQIYKDDNFIGGNSYSTYSKTYKNNKHQDNFVYSRYPGTKREFVIVANAIKSSLKSTLKHAMHSNLKLARHKSAYNRIKDKSLKPGPSRIRFFLSKHQFKDLTCN